MFLHPIDFNNTKQAKKKKQDYVNYFNVPVFFFKNFKMKA